MGYIFFATMDIIEKTNKFTLCIMPTQMGKTFTTVSRISSEIVKDTEFGNSLHIVLTMNTLLNSHQFCSRLDSIESKNGKGSVITFSSKRGNVYQHASNILELRGYFMSETLPRVIVMCNNDTRHNDCVEFVKELNTSSKFGVKRVFIYYDELHKYVDKLRKQMRILHDLDIVSSMMGITATPLKIFLDDSDFWSNIQTIQLSELNESDYVGYKNMNYVAINDYFPVPYKRPSARDYEALDNTIVEFVQHTLKKYPKILSRGSRVFIPAHIRQQGHYRIRELIFKKCSDAVVIVINGTKKTIKFQSEGMFYEKDIIPTGEIAYDIHKLLVLHGLLARPLVYTGFICVGMGQTLVNSDLGCFTAAIFGHMDLTNDDMYQLFGRITGRMKKWPTYVKTNVYCPSVIIERCADMEKSVWTILSDFNGETITKNDYVSEHSESTRGNYRPDKKAKTVCEIDDDREFRVFDTQDEALKYSREHEFGFRKRLINTAPKGFLTPDGSQPTAEYLYSRLPGLSSKDDTNPKNKARMVPIRDRKWCIYWRPSFFKK